MLSALMLRVILLCVVMLSVILLSAVMLCHYAESCYAECRCVLELAWQTHRFFISSTLVVLNTYAGRSGLQYMKDSIYCVGLIRLFYEPNPA